MLPAAAFYLWSNRWPFPWAPSWCPTSSPSPPPPTSPTLLSLKPVSYLEVGTYMKLSQQFWTEYPDIGFWISVIGYRILHIGYRISDIGYWILQVDRCSRSQAPMTLWASALVTTWRFTFSPSSSTLLTLFIITRVAFIWLFSTVCFQMKTWRSAFSPSTLILYEQRK